MTKKIIKIIIISIIIIIISMLILGIIGGVLYFTIEISTKSNFESICGNGICEFDESISSCFDDCREIGEFCGDGICQDSENENSCNEDCEVITGILI